MTIHTNIAKLLLSAAVLVTAGGGASAQSAANISATNLLAGFSQLGNTSAGQLALDQNLATAIHINNVSTVAMRNQAISDNSTASLVGGMSNGVNLADGLGQSLLATYQTKNTVSANFTSTAVSANVSNLFTQLNTITTASDSAFMKNFFANGTKNGTVPATGVSLPGDGVFNVYDKAYHPLPANANTVGNSRPVQVAPQSIQTFTGPDYFGVATDSATILPTLKSNASFPSGHSSAGFTSSFLLAMMVPERFQQEITRGAEFGNSRIVLGAHYPLDVIGARIHTLYALVQAFQNNPNYTSQTLTGLLGGTVTTTNDFKSLYAAATTDVRGLLSTCAGGIAVCAANTTGDRFADTAQNKANYTYWLTYGLSPVGPTNVDPVVPVGAEVLLASRFPYLTGVQLRDVLATTEIASGQPLDDGSGYARINLYDAADGYGAFKGVVTVAMDASKGGFNAYDSWNNNITDYKAPSTGVVTQGALVKTGTGTLQLTGISSYSGATTVSGGTLIVSGALTASTVTAQSGGTLAGTGSVAGIVAASGGTISPGAGAGTVATLASTGAISFQPGSTYAVDLTTAADKLTATGAANLLGGTVVVAGTGAQFNFNTTYQILSATGGRTGTFAGITASGFSPAFAPVLSYDGTSAYIKLAPNSIDTLLGSTPVSSNVQNVATAFDTATAAGWNPQQFYALYLQGANLPTALNQLSGEIHSVERRAAIDDTRYVREAAFDRLGAGVCSLDGAEGTPDGKSTTVACSEKFAVWGRYVGSWGTNQSDGNGSYFKTSVNGIIVGIDATFNQWKVGALFNRTTDHVDLANGLGSSSVQSTGGGVYAGYSQAGTYGFAASVGGTYAGADFRSGRTITAPGLGQTLQTDAKGNVGQLFGEVAYDLDPSATARAEPFLRFAWVTLKTDAFMEGGGYAALVGDNQSYDTNFTTFGIRASTDLGTLALRGSVGWMHAGGDRSPQALLAIQGTNSPASIYGVAFDEDTVALEAAVDYSFGAARIGVGYIGILGDNTKDNGVTATLSWGF